MWEPELSGPPLVHHPVFRLLWPTSTEPHWPSLRRCGAECEVSEWSTDVQLRGSLALAGGRNDQWLHPNGPKAKMIFKALPSAEGFAKWIEWCKVFYNLFMKKWRKWNTIRWSCKEKKNRTKDGAIRSICEMRHVSYFYGVSWDAHLPQLHISQ